ncbi:hypothetical protein J4471_02395 [Candidatus Woesearchaeota archaeon]|nr:hypothetical protein [Candidatus Woesearchaeota archaeon]
MNKIILTLVILIAFFSGFLVDSLFFRLNSPKELPFNSLFSVNYEKVSPSDSISEKDIEIFPNKVIINIENSRLSSFEDTNSMDPLFDINHNGLEVKAECSQLSLGDIISYKANWIDGIVIHRIIDIKEDKQGAYFLTKGDNSNRIDPQKIRCNEIQNKLIGVLY